MGTDLRADADEATADETELETAVRVKRIEVLIRAVVLAVAVSAVFVVMKI